MVNDSILEENDPIQLDLEKRQLFMDTTRNSIFFKKQRERKPHRFNIGSIHNNLEHIRKYTTIEYTKIANFNRNWLSLNQY